MKKEPVYLKLDSRNRVSLTKLSKDLSGLYKAYSQNGKIILDPVKEIPENEAWLFEPRNKEILKRLKQALEKPATIDLGSFKKYLPKKK